jgi:hypothetical protein
MENKHIVKAARELIRLQREVFEFCDRLEEATGLQTGGSECGIVGHDYELLHLAADILGLPKENDNRNSKKHCCREWLEDMLHEGRSVSVIVKAIQEQAQYYEKVEKR